MNRWMGLRGRHVMAFGWGLDSCFGILISWKAGGTGGDGREGREVHLVINKMHRNIVRCISRDGIYRFLENSGFCRTRSYSIPDAL